MNAQKPADAINRLSTLFFRSVDAWNALQVTLYMSKPLSTFKNGHKRIDLSVQLTGSADQRINLSIALRIVYSVQFILYITCQLL
jgi:hypothetical protein